MLMKQRVLMEQQGRFWTGQVGTGSEPTQTYIIPVSTYTKPILTYIIATLDVHFNSGCNTQLVMLNVRFHQQIRNVVSVPSYMELYGTPCQQALSICYRAVQDLTHMITRQLLCISSHILGFVILKYVLHLLNFQKLHR